MPFYGQTDNGRRHSGSYRRSGCASGRSKCSEVRIPSCNCRSSNVGCLDRSDCGGLRPTGAATDTCLGPCQCAEEEIWNSNAPPKPNCQWLNDFTELRRQWSDHGRQQQAYKCCSCRPPCRTVVPCRLCLSPMLRCSGTALTSSDCQRCCGNRRLAGGASKSEMVSTDESSSSAKRSLKREAGGGGCSPPDCAYPSTCRDSPNADCSVSSSCCPTRCGHSPPSSHRRPSSDCRSCATSLRPILKKRLCHRCTASNCSCQPAPRGCGCPPPVTVDVRAVRAECTCDCTSLECACSPNERGRPRVSVKCSDARSCCPALFSRPPSVPPKCHCARYRPCSPSPCCDPCATTVVCPSCSVRPSSSCRPLSPCALCSPCQPASMASGSSYRPATPRRKLTSCVEQSDRASSSSCARTGQFWCDIADDETAAGRDVGDDDVEGPQGNDTTDRDGSCDYRRAASDDECHDPIPDEESVENLESSETFISPLEGTGAISKSVDPASHDVTQQVGESLPENTTAEGSEECVFAEEPSEDPERHPSSLHVVVTLSDNRARSDPIVFRDGRPPVGEDMPGNPILARLSSRTRSPVRIYRENFSAPSKLSAREPVVAPRGITRIRVVGPSPSVSMKTSTRINDRRHGDGKSWTRNTLHSNRVSCTTSAGTSGAYARTREERNGSACCDVFSNLSGIGRSILVPGPLALISFALLILVAVTCSSSLIFYRRYLLPRKRICWKRLGL